MFTTKYPFTDEMIKEFLSLYPNIKNKVLAKRFNCTYSVIVNYAYKHKLHKADGFFSKPKNIPTKFKKGIIPANTKPVGYEIIKKSGYTYVKTAQPNTFKAKHRLIWEQLHGEIPPGYIVRFKDGNCQNFSPENLYMISRKDQLNQENRKEAKVPGLLELIHVHNILKTTIKQKKHGR